MGLQSLCFPVPESDAVETKEQPRTVGNDESKRWRGGKGSSVKMEERMNYAYATMLEGGTRRQVLQKVMDRFGVSEITAHRDYTAAVQILKTEQIETRENLLNQIQALRLATVKKALSKGQLQTVAMLLKDMGAVIGEAAPEQLATNAPTLNITVEDKRQA
jgi:methylphosphotriester-DNA--protein-cysteine methyltransferase